MNSNTPYSDKEGWVKAGVSRPRKNPAYSFFNALWTPRTIEQDQYLKVWQDQGFTKLLVKWVSNHPRYKLEESEE